MVNLLQIGVKAIRLFQSYIKTFDFLLDIQPLTFLIHTLPELTILMSIKNVSASLSD